MKKQGVGVYSIGAVAKMLDISAQTLRSWEERYAQVVPARSAGGQRLYSRDQVAQLRFLTGQIAEGLQPADAHRLLADRLSVASGRDDTELISVAPPWPEAAGPHEPESKLAILIAERDPYAADFADYFLRTEGYGARIALDVAEARQVMRETPPDLIVVDLLISGGRGLELCRDVREASSIPILAVSAIASDDAALASGADAFLPKPLDPLQFVSTIRDLLGTSAYLRNERRFS